MGTGIEQGPEIPDDGRGWGDDPRDLRRRSRNRVRAVTLSLAAVAAVGTGVLAADLGAFSSSAVSTTGTSTPGTSTTGTSSTGFGQVSTPGSTSQSGSVAASSGGS